MIFAYRISESSEGMVGCLLLACSIHLIRLSDDMASIYSCCILVLRLVTSSSNPSLSSKRISNSFGVSFSASKDLYHSSLVSFSSM